MIKLRLTNGTSWAAEFFANDSESLKTGCKKSWRKFIAKFGEAHMKAEHALRERLEWIDQWEQKKINQWSHDPTKQQQCKDQAAHWRFRDEREFEGKNRMPDSLQLHVASVDEIEWLSSGMYSLTGEHGCPPLAPHTVSRTSDNDYNGLWVACELTHQHDLALCQFCDSIAGWVINDEIQDKKHHLKIVE